MTTRSCLFGYCRARSCDHAGKRSAGRAHVPPGKRSAAALSCLARGNHPAAGNLGQDTRWAQRRRIVKDGSLKPRSSGGHALCLGTKEQCVVCHCAGGGGAPKRAKVAAPQPVPTRRPKHRPFASMEAPQLRELAREASKEKKGKDAKLQRQARVIAIQNRIITDSEQKVKAAHFAAGAWSLRRLRPALLP